MTIRILIADDHAVIRSGLNELLEKEDDFTIVGEAGNGLEAIKAISSLDVDVLLLDISMPGMPGPRVAEQVLAIQPDLAIVVLTMHDDIYYLQEMFKIGARAFVLKKSSGSDLIQAIRSAHKHQQFIDPHLTGHVISSFIGQPTGVDSTNDRLGVLTAREQQVLRFLALGHTNSEISEHLSISIRTVDSHRRNIMDKLELKGRAQLVRFAIDNGLLGIT